MKIPTAQIDDVIQNEKFLRGGRYNLRPNAYPNFSDSN